jgi:hypothetical protein
VRTCIRIEVDNDLTQLFCYAVVKVDYAPFQEAKRHIQEKKEGEHRGKMIAYRSSDMIWDQNSDGSGLVF